MSGYKVDHQRVVKMSRIYTNKVVSDRLGISTRQVSRILKKHNASKADHRKRNRKVDREVEDVLMSVQRDSLGMSLADVGYYNGLSRQAVHQRLSTVNSEQ